MKKTNTMIVTNAKETDKQSQGFTENGIPLQVTANKGKAFGIASSYANTSLIAKEKGAFADAMEAKHVSNRRECNPSVFDE